MIRQPEILLIEDNLEDQAQALRVLKKYRIANDVASVQDGEEALKLLGNGKYGLAPDSPAGKFRPEMILLAGNQPGLGAPDVIRRLRSLPGMENVPIVLCCSTPEAELQARASGVARVAILSKPMGFFKLLECIQKLGMHWQVFSERPAQP